MQLLKLYNYSTVNLKTVITGLFFFSFTYLSIYLLTVNAMKQIKIMQYKLHTIARDQKSRCLVYVIPSFAHHLSTVLSGLNRPLG